MFASKLKDDIFLIIIGPDIHKPKMNISKNLLNIFRPIWNQKIGEQYNFSIISNRWSGSHLMYIVPTYPKRIYLCP